MTARIAYNQGLQTGKMVAQAVHQALEAKYAMRRVQDLLDKAQWGNPADWASLALELGLKDQPGYTALQQASDLWSIMSTATGKLTGPEIAELARLDQG